MFIFVETMSQWPNQSPEPTLLATCAMGFRIRG